MSNVDPHTAVDKQARYWRDEDNPQTWQPGGEGGRTADVGRVRGPAARALTGELTAWRQTVVYVGDVAAGDTPEIGLGTPPVGGAMLRRVTLRVRSDFVATDGIFDLQRRDLLGVMSLIARQTTETQAVTANVLFEVYHTGAGVRFEPNHELTLLVTTVGSGLTGLAVYADWYVGL